MGVRWVSLALLTLSGFCVAGCTPGGSGPSTPTPGGTPSKRSYHVTSPRVTPPGVAPVYQIMTNGNSPFWDAVRAGMVSAGKDFNVQVDLVVNDGTTAGQIEKLRQIRTLNHVVGVGISVIEARAAGVADEMRNLQQAGVHVVAIDSDVDRELFRDTRYAFIGTNNFEAGKVLGQAIRGLRPGGAKYVTFVGIANAQNARDRIRGVAEGTGEGFEAADHMADDVDRTRARENVRNAIRNHPDATILVGIWSYNAPAIVDIVKQEKVRDKYLVAVFDAEPLTIRAMEEGYVDVMVVQNPYMMGYMGVRLLKALVEKDEATPREMFPNYGQPDGDIYDTGLKVVVPDGDTRLKPEMFGKNVEFLMLSEFKKWLDKYGLTGS
jgi:ribose transport system substrate-binding protein